MASLTTQPDAAELDKALTRLRSGRVLRIVHELAMTAGELQAHLRSTNGTAEMVGMTDEDRQTLVHDAGVVIGGLENLSRSLRYDRPKRTTVMCHHRTTKRAGEMVQCTDLCGAVWLPSMIRGPHPVRVEV